MHRHFIVLLILIIAILPTAISQKLSVDSLKNLVANNPDDTNKVIHYRMITGLLRLTNPAEGMRYGQTGVALGKKLGFDKGIAGCYLNISSCYNSAGKLDSALIFIDSAAIYSKKAKDPNRLSLVYLNRADYNMQLQNFDQSLRDCDTSMYYAELAGSDDRRARVLQTIGSIYFFQDNWARSMEYYDKANELYLKIGNLQMSAIVLNNLAIVYKHTGQYELAAQVIQKAIVIADSLQDLSNLSMYHGTLSDVYYSMEQYQPAARHAQLSLDYANQISNEIQLSYGYQYLGQVYLRQNKVSEGIALLLKGFDISKRINDLDKIHLSADLLAEAYASTGNTTKAYEFLRISKEASDSLARQRYDEDIAAMQTRFRVGEKDKEILLLNKDKELQQQRLSRQRVLFIGSMTLIVLVLIGISLYISRYRLQNRMKELELRQRIAADLHDEVGSSLSSIHMLSQIASQQQKDDATGNDILQRLSNNARETMDKMSDIVWMIKPGDGEGNLKLRIEQYVYELNSDLNIDITTELGALEKENLTMEQRRNIYLIFKEAMNNALKYSGSGKVDIKTNVADKILTMMIKDYGTGFDQNTRRKGNGLGNMYKRAKELGGHLAIQSEPGKGTVIELTTPI